MMIKMILCMGAVSVLVSLPAFAVDDQPSPTSRSPFRAKTVPEGPVEMELEPMRKEPPLGQGTLSPEAGSQAGVQVKLRRRSAPKSDVKPEKPARTE